MSDHNFLGQGWAFPPTFSAVTKELVMSQSEQNIDQSIDLILQTNRGERSLQPEFGSNLRSFLFRNRDTTLKTEIAQSVRNTLLNDEPRIRVDDVEVIYTDQDSDNMVVISVAYTVKKTNARHNHVFPFSLLEGTNLTVEQQGAHPR